MCGCESDLIQFLVNKDGEVIVYIPAINEYAYMQTSDFIEVDPDTLTPLTEEINLDNYKHWKKEE